MLSKVKIWSIVAIFKMWDDCDSGSSQMLGFKFSAQIHRYFSKSFQCFEFWCLDVSRHINGPDFRYSDVSEFYKCSKFQMFRDISDHIKMSHIQCFRVRIFRFFQNLTNVSESRFSLVSETYQWSRIRMFRCFRVQCLKVQIIRYFRDISMVWISDVNTWTLKYCYDSNI